MQRVEETPQVAEQFESHNANFGFPLHDLQPPIKAFPQVNTEADHPGTIFTGYLEICKITGTHISLLYYINYLK